MPKTKVRDIAFCRLQSPDLDLAEAFLTDFGLVRAARTPDALYMRGTDPAHHIHVTHLGDPRFIGLAYHVDDPDDLKAIAQSSEASGIETIDEPGGGKRVRLTDPNGYTVEVVHGIEAVDPLPIQANVLNWGTEKLRRTGDLMRLDAGPSRVKRIAHAVTMTPNIDRDLKWYREMFGFVSSDDVYEDSKENIVASFNRCDRGEAYVDHHTFLCFKGPTTGLNHVSFEVQSFDDLMLGQEHLLATGRYRHVWGVGRHFLGSQIFDYWQDPWDRIHEHWTDSDMLNIRGGSNLLSVEEAFRSQWGGRPPEFFAQHATP